MKKKYEKPMLIMESFQLDATIAASCSSENYLPLGYSENTCGIDPLPGGRYQLFGPTNCEFDLVSPSGNGNDLSCYHGPMLTDGVMYISS